MDLIVVSGVSRAAIRGSADARADRACGCGAALVYLYLLVEADHEKGQPLFSRNRRTLS